MKVLKLAPVLLIASALALAGCANTVRGVGKDVKNTGAAVEDTIEG